MAKDNLKDKLEVFLYDSIFVLSDILDFLYPNHKKVSDEEFDKWFDPWAKRMEETFYFLYRQYNSDVSKEEKAINDLTTLLCEIQKESLLVIGAGKLHSKVVSDGMKVEIKKYVSEKIDNLPNLNPLFHERLCEIRNYLQEAISKEPLTDDFCKKLKRELAKMAKLKLSREEAAWRIYESCSGKKYDKNIGVHISVEEGAFIALLLMGIGYIDISKLNWNRNYVEKAMRKSWWQMVKHHFRPKK